MSPLVTTYDLVSAGRRVTLNTSDMALALDAQSRGYVAGAEPAGEVLVWIVGPPQGAKGDRLLAAAVLESVDEIRDALVGDKEGPYPIFVPVGQVLDVARGTAPLPSIELGAVVATIEA